MTPEVTLRPANPTPEDGAIFAGYMNMAAEDAFTVLLGRRAEEILARAYLSPAHDFSYEHVTLAVLDDEVVGMVSGYTAEQHAEASDRPLMRAAGLASVRLIAAYAVGRGMKSFMHTVPAGDYYVHAAAVEETKRGMGIGSLLLDHLEEEARRSGSKRFVLDVSVMNDRGKSLYKRRGMTVEARSPKILGARDSGVYRMVKNL